jgi:hypothetical protein
VRGIGRSGAVIPKLPSLLGQPMPSTATGRFDVSMIPKTPDDPATGARLGRLSLRKTFEGELVGTSEGEMLTAMSEVEGSAGYVAIERVTAKLAGREGSFVLQHSGTMDRGDAHLLVSVVPDSGATGFVGIRGTMEINVAEGEHTYRFEYEFSPPSEPTPPVP